MSFHEKYKVQAIPLTSQSARAEQSPEDRARAKLLAALETQRALLAAELKGKSYTVTRNGKQMKPRPFWVSTPVGVAFTPRFGNQFLFDKGQGVLVGELADMAGVLTDFEAAVLAKEFDQQITAMANARGRSDAGDEPTQVTKRGRGRPRGS